jgi:hypothetical protein
VLFEAVLVSQAAGLLQAAGVLEQQQLCLREGFLAAGGRVTAGACKKQQNKATSLRLLLSASQTTLAREWRETATLAGCSTGQDAWKGAVTRNALVRK